MPSKKPHYMDIMGKPRPRRQDPLLERRVNRITVDDFAMSKKPATPKKTSIKISPEGNSSAPAPAKPAPTIIKPSAPVAKPAPHTAPAPEPTIKLTREPAAKPIIRRSPRFRNVDVSSKKRPLSSPRPTMSEMKRPKLQKLEQKPEQNPVQKSPEPTPEKPAEKSPFINTVAVDKRPLGTITTKKATFAPIPEFVHESAPGKRTKSEKRRARAPFFVIILLAILLGVAVGALIYFVFPK